MTTITDWLMFGITVVYVIATVAIYKSNKASAKATREQVEISTKQIDILQKQLKQSTNLQLLDRRLDLLKSFEGEDAFTEPEPLLRILFPESICEVEKELLSLRKERQAILHSFFCVAKNIRLTGNFSELFKETVLANATISQIQGFIAPIKSRAKDEIAPSGEPFLDVVKGQQMEDAAIRYTKELELKKEDFFIQAREFISKSFE